MTSRILPLALAGAIALAAAPAADAAKRKPKRTSATYMTTIKVDYAAKWQYTKHTQHECLPGVCSTEDKGSGSTTAFMKTKRPFPLWVLRGYNGRPPTLNFGSIGWQANTGPRLTLQVDVDPFREGCPTGPAPEIEWEGGESLLLQDVVASVGKGKFLGTKQFTVRGATTVKGLIPTHTDWHFNQSGDAEVTIRWEATFRMKG